MDQNGLNIGIYLRCQEVKQQSKFKKKNNGKIEHLFQDYFIYPEITLEVELSLDSLANKCLFLVSILISRALNSYQEALKYLVSVQ